MIRTSRKWKNAVRYQARLASQGELKVHETLSAVANVPSAPTWAYFSLLDGIIQGLGAEQRIGDEIRVKRVDCLVAFYAGDKPSSELHCAAALCLYREPQFFSPKVDSQTVFQSTGLPGVDWTRRGERLRVTGGWFNGGALAGTPEYVDVLKIKTCDLIHAPRGVKASNYTNFQSITQPTATVGTFTRAASEMHMQGTYPFTGGAAGVAGPETPGTALYRIVRAADSHGPLMRTLRISKTFGPQGLRVRYVDNTDPTAQQPMNQLVMHFGCSYFSDPALIPGPGTHAANCKIYVRVWYTDD